MKTKRKIAGGGNGTPFTDDQLAQIELHELFHEGVRDDPMGDLIFVYAKRLKPGEVYGWPWLLEITQNIESFNRKHSVYQPAWDEFPHSSADIAKVIAWRAGKPRG